MNWIMTPQGSYGAGWDPNQQPDWCPVDVPVCGVKICFDWSCRAYLCFILLV